MITIDRGFLVELGTSTEKLLKYLDKTNQDLVVSPRRPNQPSRARAVETRQALVKPVPEDATLKQNSVSQYEIVEEPSGSLISSWTRNFTLKFKQYLEAAYPIQMQSLVRGGDLGIRSPKEKLALGVILDATYNLSYDQSRRHYQKCYVLSYTGICRLYSLLNIVKVTNDVDVFYFDQQGNVHQLKNIGRKER